MVVFFFPKGLFGWVSALRGYLAVFLPKGAIWKKFWAVGVLPYFGPMKRPDFETDFQLGKRGNFDYGAP